MNIKGENLKINVEINAKVLNAIKKNFIKIKREIEKLKEKNEDLQLQIDFIIEWQLLKLKINKE